MSIDEALTLLDHAFKANFDGTIPDAFLAPAVYRLWLDTLRTLQDFKRLQLLQAKVDMQQTLLLEIDERMMNTL